ncbi:MAG: hypothetical protein K2G25_02880, partial [Oscillospiraceae bacterium]|nr:hypothetical protein [Oscillospiraceae bacterium]
MRDYKTVAQRVLQRRDAYVLAQKRKKQMIIKYAAVPACLFLVIGAGVRIWKQTDSGRHILGQNAVEMTEDATTATSADNLKNSENLNSTSSALYEYETETQDSSDAPTLAQTGEILQATTETIQTDAESEPGHEANSEMRQTEHVMTEVIKLEFPAMQETEPEQNAISPVDSTKPTEKIPEPTVPADDNTATAPPSPSTDPPESDYMPEPTETKQDEPPSVPDATEPTKPNEPNEANTTILTESEPTETDNPPALEPSTTEPSSSSDWVAPTETDPSNSYEPPMTTDTTTSVKKPTDYTITVEEFTPTNEQLSNVTHETISMNFSENYDSFQQLFENVKAAVHCKVLSVAYTIMQDTPYTVYNIEILESIYGTFIAGDKLSIVQYGGYLLPQNLPVLTLLQISEPT